MTRRIMKDFTINEISAVDRPAQSHARMTIMKRADDVAETIAKRWIDPADGARPFSEFMTERVRSKQFHEVQEDLWPLYSSMQDSVSSIMGDANLNADQRLSKTRESVEQFLNAVREKIPGVEAELSKLMSAGDAGDPIGKKENIMPDEIKKVADLEKSVADLTAKLAKADADRAEAEVVAKMSDKEKAFMAGLKDDKAKKEFLEMPADERAKKVSKAVEDDEVLKVDGTDIRKSAVGETMFAVLKSQQAAITKQAEDLKKADEKALMSELRKQADDNFPHVPGTTDERAAMLKAMAGMDEVTRKSFEAVFTQSERLAKTAFDTLGSQADPAIAKRGADFEKRVAEIEAGGKVSKTDAMRQARQLYPDEFKAYQGEAA